MAGRTTHQARADAQHTREAAEAGQADMRSRLDAEHDRAEASSGPGPQPTNARMLRNALWLSCRRRSSDWAAPRPKATSAGSGQERPKKSIIPARSVDVQAPRTGRLERARQARCRGAYMSMPKPSSAGGSITGSADVRSGVWVSP